MSTPLADPGGARTFSPHARRLWTRAAAVSVCAVALAAAASARAAAGWWYVSSDHFEVLAAGNETRARDAIADFEQVHAFFEHFFALPDTPAPRTRLIVFSDPQEYARYRPNAVAAAFYESAPDGDFIVLPSLDTTSLPVVVHEYAHVMIRRSAGDYPLWLNEGLAEFFSTMTPEGGKMRLGLPPRRRLATLASSPWLMPLDELFAITQQSPDYVDEDRAAIFYAESWALTHMLATDDHYRKRFADVLGMVGQGTGTAEALTAIYGESLRTIASDLDHYVRHNGYGHLIVDAPVRAEDTRVNARPASGVEADVTLAALRGWQAGHEDQARAMFDAVAARAPDDLRLAESRGLLEAFTRHPDAARVFLSRAVDLGSTNPVVLRQYAGVIGATDPSRQEALLTRAVALAPNDINARIDLARMLVLDGRGTDAMTALGTAARVPKDSAFSFYEALTLAAVEAGDVAAARTAAAKATRAAGTDADRAKANTLMREAAGASSDREAVGRLTNVICGAGSTILEIATGTGVLRLSIDNPRGVSLPAGATAALTIDCGEQNQPIRVGYTPAFDKTLNTVGVVRMIGVR